MTAVIPRPVASGPRPTDPVELWVAALARIWQIPVDHREPVVDRFAALDMLRCGEAVLQELITAGLQVQERDGTQWFDRYDLFNLSLASGSGTSVPELAIRYALRWMSGEPDSWFVPLRWSFDIELRCPAAGPCEPSAGWSHACLEPAAGGGELLEFGVTADSVRQSDGRVWMTGADSVRLAGELRTAGRRQRLQSPRLRSIVQDFFALDLPWARMPEALQCEYERVIGAGVAPCISASLWLQREFESAGYRASTRRGWLLGMLDLAHSWVEVVDDDGQTKVIDPIFHRLVEHADRPNPELAPAVVGSRVNRLLPAAIPADGTMVTHHCHGSAGTPERRTVIRRVGR